MGRVASTKVEVAIPASSQGNEPGKPRRERDARQVQGTPQASTTTASHGGKRRRGKGANKKTSAVAESIKDTEAKVKSEVDTLKDQLSELKSKLADLQARDPVVVANQDFVASTTSRLDAMKAADKLYSAENLQASPDPYTGPVATEKPPSRPPKREDVIVLGSAANHPFWFVKSNAEGWSLFLDRAVTLVFFLTLATIPVLCGLAKWREQEPYLDMPHIMFNWAVKIWFVAVLALPILYFLQFVLWLIGANSRRVILAAKLVLIKKGSRLVSTDARPEMFRADRMKNINVDRFEIAFKVTYCEYNPSFFKRVALFFKQLDQSTVGAYSDFEERTDFVYGDDATFPTFYPPKRFMSSMPWRGRDVYIIRELLPTLLNQKTLLTADRKIGIDRATRLMEANGYYSEDYELLLREGVSAMRDTLAAASVIIEEAVDGESN